MRTDPDWLDDATRTIGQYHARRDKDSYAAVLLSSQKTLRQPDVGPTKTAQPFSEPPSADSPPGYTAFVTNVCCF
ncbi:MAG: hypothetical protein WBS33_04695 [Verrucomicrobiia bacterium]